MRLPRVRYSLLALMALIAAAGVIMGTLKAVEREQVRTSLGRDRLKAAEQGYKLGFRRWQGGEIRLADLYAWSVRVMEAERDLNNTWTGKLDAVEAHQRRIEAIGQLITNPRGCASDLDILELRFYMKEAASWVAMAR